jgi:2-C-methyl-D-erythritol 2,4-cyclodiphosphate synthase
MSNRIGIGFDLHLLVQGRKLILGGIQIPFEKGLLGHSDADVLTHSLCDALLGAAALGDIGQHFPDTSAEFKDICSLDLLYMVMSKITQLNYKIVNIDSIIIADEPQLSPHINKMRERLSQLLKIQPAQISIKATTAEGLFSSRDKPLIAAQTVVLISKE